MKKLLRNTVVTTLIFVFGFSGNEATAREYCSYLAGCGYEECCSAPCLTPAIAFGAITLGAIIAVAMQHSHGNTLHEHAHD